MNGRQKAKNNRLKQVFANHTVEFTNQLSICINLHSAGPIASSSWTNARVFIIYTAKSNFWNLRKIGRPRRVFYRILTLNFSKKYMNVNILFFWNFMSKCCNFCDAWFFWNFIKYLLQFRVQCMSCGFKTRQFLEDDIKPEIGPNWLHHTVCEWRSARKIRSRRN